MAVTDSITGCGSVALSFYQMLASTIVGYHDLAGALHYRINGIFVSGDCTDLHSLVDCNINHFEAERLLVENVFASDDCGFLGLKIFSNSSTGTDYSDCGEMPQTFIQMLARCIVGYHDLAGVLHYRLNLIQATDNCDDLVDLLDCTTNAIESERLIVENCFATDDCGNLALKTFLNSGDKSGEGTVDDYSINCTELSQSFIQMFARCIVLYSDHYRVNLLSVSPDCDDLHAFWTCSNNHLDPEKALVDNVFATDDCGHLAMKVANDQGERQ